MRELIIPVGIDATKAILALKRIGEAGKEAGEKGSSGIQSMTDEMLKFAGVTSTLDTAKRVIEAMNEGIKHASEYATNAAKAFISLQESLRQIAALSGKPLDDNLAQDVIDRAKRSGILTPNEVQEGMTQWNKGGSGYVISPENPRGLIEEGVANELQDEFMAYGKAHGISAKTSMYWLSTLVQKLPRGTKADTYRKIFYESMKIARMSRGSEDETISQVSEIVSGYVGEGLAFGEGEKGILAALSETGVQQETHQGSAGHYEKNLLMFFDRLAASPDKEEELGITEDMTVRQKLEKVNEAWQKSGLKKFSKFINQYVKGQGNIQQKLALQTAIEEGIKSGRYGAWDEMIAKSDFHEEQKAVQKFKQDTRPGRKYGRASEEESATLEHGKEFADVEELKEEIEKEVKVQGFEGDAFKQGAADMARYGLSILPGVGSRLDQIKKQALFQILHKHAFGGSGTLAGEVEKTRYRFSGLSQEQEAKRLLGLAAQRENTDEHAVFREVLAELKAMHRTYERGVVNAEKAAKPPLGAAPPPQEPHGARP